MTRPRLTKQELELISYSLLVLEQLSENKMKELDDLPSELKKFARIVWFTGDLKAFRLFKPYKQYVLSELGRRRDFFQMWRNAGVLRRRIEGLLNGRKLHSKELWQ